MEIINGIQDIAPEKKLVLTIGMFDGVHKGHQSIISKINQYAKEIGGHSALLSFHPHPRTILQPNCNLSLLTTLEEKLDLLKSYSLDYTILHPFSIEFSKLSSYNFVKDYLVNKLHIHTLLVGHDHHFGRDRSGDFNQLIGLSNQFSFKALQLSAILENEKPISSTKIREALMGYDIRYVSEALGYHYTISGNVIHGNKIGRKLKYPTLNICIPKEKLLPADGVYGVKVQHRDGSHFGLMNIGNRPTFDFEEHRVEVFLLDYEGNLYDEFVKVQILSFIRKEKKFDSLDALKAQIYKDETFFRLKLQDSFF